MRQNAPTQCDPQMPSSQSSTMHVADVAWSWAQDDRHSSNYESRNGSTLGSHDHIESWTCDMVHRPKIRRYGVVAAFPWGILFPASSIVCWSNIRSAKHVNKFFFPPLISLWIYRGLSDCRGEKGQISRCRFLKLLYPHFQDNLSIRALIGPFALSRRIGLNTGRTCLFFRHAQSSVLEAMTMIQILCDLNCILSTPSSIQIIGLGRVDSRTIQPSTAYD